MITINIICVGNLKEKYWKEACNEYIKRLSRFCNIKITEIEESVPDKEKNLILKSIEGYTVALCIEGEALSSEAFAEKIEKTSLFTSKICFIIGGSTGLSAEVKKASAFCISFSAFTFPHQMMRLILLEQLYRAFTINNNITYHK